MQEMLMFQLKWHDGYGGHGEHYFDYNHGNAYKEPHHTPAYGPPGLHSEPEPAIVDTPAEYRV